MGDAALETATDPCLGLCGRPASPGQLVCDACRPLIERKHAAHRPRERAHPQAAPTRAGTAIALPSRATCVDCNAPRSGIGLRCDGCQASFDDRRRREHEAREAEREAMLFNRRQAYALTRVPCAFADDRKAYEAAVRSKKFRAVAERYDLARGNLLLLGTSGAGKTVTVARALRRLIRAATSSSDRVLGVRWVAAVQLSRARRFHRLGEGDAPEIVEAVGAPLLVLDELGLWPDDGVILEVLDQRYLRGRVTLSTSGARLDELRSHFGDGCVRRLMAPTGLVVEDWA